MFYLRLSFKCTQNTVCVKPKFLATVARTNASGLLDRATLKIRNGPVFNGFSFGANKNVSGEAVFTTSLVGYPESMVE